MKTASAERQAANDNGSATTSRRCPICGKPARIDTRPFCSTRCADVDLHRWLGGTYAIPAAESDESNQNDDADA